ncbi:MAG: GNAT family N-acetyltransferase [Myxococcales bacterium]|nr:GNAT family N-acetyltransferase [Myxococcales bacterium]
MGHPAVFTVLVDNRGESYTIRQATESDCRSILTHKLLIFSETDLLLQTSEDLDRDLSHQSLLLRQYRTSVNSTFIVAERHGEIIGSLSLFGGPFRRNRHVAQLGMGVRSTDWGKGIGGALLDTAIVWAKTNEFIQKITLQVYHTNSRAILLYQRRGFVEEGRLVREVRLDDHSFVDLISMRRFV